VRRPRGDGAALSDGSNLFNAPWPWKFRSRRSRARRSSDAWH